MAKKEKEETKAETKALAEEAANAEEVKAEENIANAKVITPVAYEIKLRAIHPHDSYGRCGYRFSKTQASVIVAQDLTGEQILTLAEDPWLELTPVCEA